MLKKIFLPLIIFLFFLNITPVFADNHDSPLCRGGQQIGEPCPPPTGADLNFRYQCQPDKKLRGDDGKPLLTCQKSSVLTAFGRIEVPAPLKSLLQKDPTGAGAISDFLSRFISLLYIIAAIVLIFMILWGAFEWLTSGGDKEKLANAQRRLINAFIGILLFAAAFAIIAVLGAFTGFKFFRGQNIKLLEKYEGGVIRYQCPGEITYRWAFPPDSPDCP